MYIEAVRNVEVLDNVLYGRDTSFTFENELEMSLDEYILREAKQRLQNSNNQTFMASTNYPNYVYTRLLIIRH